MDSRVDTVPIGSRSAQPEALQLTDIDEDLPRLYFRQLVESPMISKEEQLQYGQDIDTARNEFRSLALGSPLIAEGLIQNFHLAIAGKKVFDDVFDVSKSDKCKEGFTLPLQRTKSAIAERLHASITEMESLCAEVRAGCVQLFAQTAESREQVGQAIAQKQERLRALVSRLYPKMSLMEELGDGLALLHDCLKEKPAELEVDAGQSSETIGALLAKMAVVRSSYRESRRKLADGALRLVVVLARKCRNRGLSFADLIQDGNEGLMYATEKFVWQRGFDFTTYAAWWIRQRMNDKIARKHNTTRRVYEICPHVRAALQVLHNSGKRHPTPEDVRAQYPSKINKNGKPRSVPSVELIRQAMEFLARPGDVSKDMLVGREKKDPFGNALVDSGRPPDSLAEVKSSTVAVLSALTEPLKPPALPGDSTRF